MRNLPPRPAEGKAETAAGIHNPAARRRWQLQRHAAGLLADKTPAVDRYGQDAVHFKYRVAMCHRGTDGNAPTIKRSPDRANARFTGLQTCGSVWHCPICAPKVAAARRDEMNEALAAWKKTGREVYFLTYTMQHDAAGGGMDCAETLKKMSAALSRFKGSRLYQSTIKAAGAVGAIRALEPTFGEMNGWHIHTHELLFAEAGHIEALQGLADAWVKLLIKRGMAGLKASDTAEETQLKLDALRARAMTVQPGNKAADYVAKFGREPETDRGSWGIASEMTRAHMKQGRAAGTDGQPQRCGHVSPWGLLNDAMDGDYRSGRLFREYAEAFHGRRQLFWSPKLRAMFFGMVDRSDEDIAAADDKRCTEFVIEILPSQWAQVIAHEARFDVLRAAATGGAAAVAELLDELDTRPASRSEFFTEGWNAPPPETYYQTERGRVLYVGDR